MLQTVKELSAWKADREALKSDALAFLDVDNRRADELLLIYQAARTAYEAWAPPSEHYETTPWPHNPWTRESERAFIVMEAVAARLADIWVKASNESPPVHVAAVLADWYSACDDNPRILAALIGLYGQSKHLRGAS